MRRDKRYENSTLLDILNERCPASLAAFPDPDTFEFKVIKDIVYVRKPPTEMVVSWATHGFKFSAHASPGCMFGPLVMIAFSRKVTDISSAKASFAKALDMRSTNMLGVIR